MHTDACNKWQEKGTTMMNAIAIATLLYVMSIVNDALIIAQLRANFYTL